MFLSAATGMNTPPLASLPQSVQISKPQGGTNYDLKPLYIKQEAEILWLQVSWRASLKRPLYPHTAHSKNPVVKRHSTKNNECKFLATQKHRVLSSNYTEFKKQVHKHSFFKQDIFWVRFLKKKKKDKI